VSTFVVAEREEQRRDGDHRPQEEQTPPHEKP